MKTEYAFRHKRRELSGFSKLGAGRKMAGRTGDTPILLFKPIAVPPYLLGAEGLGGPFSLIGCAFVSSAVSGLYQLFLPTLNRFEVASEAIKVGVI